MRITVWLAILMLGLATPSLSTASAHGPRLVQARDGECPPGTHATVAQSGPGSRERLGPGSSAHCKVTFFPSDEDVRRLVQPYVDKHQAKGIVVGLVEPDGHRRVLIFGEPGEGARALSAKSVFEIGSITKTFTGTVLADMVRRRKVRLDDPVAKYLPADVRVPSRNGRQITLLDLATHMSGLPRLPTGYVSPDPGNPYAHFSAEDLYAFLNRYELEREPGEKAEYSNLGMGLLGHALARAAKAKNFDALVTSRVLKPLRMTMTAYGRTRELAPWMTKGHTQGGAVAPYFDPGVLAGGGGLNSNVVDMMTYLDANIGKPRSPIERAMRDAHRGYRPGPAAGSRMGLAWTPRARGSQTLLGHNGGTSGYSTYLAFDPAAHAGVVVLANSGGFEYADKIGRELLEGGRRPVATVSPPAKITGLIHRCRDVAEARDGSVREPALNVRRRLRLFLHVRPAPRVASLVSYAKAQRRNPARLCDCRTSRRTFAGWRRSGLDSYTRRLVGLRRHLQLIVFRAGRNGRRMDVLAGCPAQSTCDGPRAGQDLIAASHPLPVAAPASRRSKSGLAANDSIADGGRR